MKQLLILAVVLAFVFSMVPNGDIPVAAAAGMPLPRKTRQRRCSIRRKGVCGTARVVANRVPGRTCHSPRAVVSMSTHALEILKKRSFPQADRLPSDLQESTKMMVNRGSRSASQPKFLIARGLLYAGEVNA